MQAANPAISLVDHGAGKSYLGFILYDLFFKTQTNNQALIYGIETRDELVSKSQQLAAKLDFIVSLAATNQCSAVFTIGS